MRSPNDLFQPDEAEARRLSAQLREGETAEDVVVVDPTLQQTALEREVAEQLAAEEPGVTVPVYQEMQAERLTAQVTERKKIRVLYVTRDETLFENGSVSQKRFASDSPLFEEIHIVVCSTKSQEYDVLKLADNVFVYPTQSLHWTGFFSDAFSTIKREVYFAKSFRADVVCGVDTFEMGLLAYLVARRYKRGLYLDILNNILDPYYQATVRHPRIRFWIANFLIPRADIVRVRTASLRGALSVKYPSIMGKIVVLPQFTDVAALRKSVAGFNLREKYQAKYLMLMVAPLVPASNILLAIEACQVVLRQYVTVKLVIVGVGPEEQKIRDRIEEKRLTQSIFIESEEHNRFAYFKSADMFLSTAPGGIDSDMLLEIAAAGLPMLAVNVDAAAEFIENETTGLVCGIGDLNCFMRGVNAYLNNVLMRTRCGKNASDRVDSLIKSDLVNHQRLYRENVERTIISYLERTDPGEAARRGGM